MATLYWVGGSGTWDTSSTTNWSSFSGGGGGNPPPTATDDVIIDENSGVGSFTITVSGTNVPCRNLNIVPGTGDVINLSGGSTASLAIHGDLNAASGLGTATISNFSAVNFVSTAPGKSINVLSSLLTISSPFILNGVGGSWSLSRTFVSGSTFTLTNGTFSTNNFNFNCTVFNSSNSNTRTLSLTSSTVTVTGWNLSTTTNLTFNPGTSTINCSSIGGSGANNGFPGGGLVYNNVNFTNTFLSNGSVIFAITGANSFNNLSFSTQTSISVVTISANQTISGALDFAGNSTKRLRLLIKSLTTGVPVTLSIGSVSNLTNIDFQDITVTGIAAPISGTFLGNCGGNTNITFVSGTTKYWNLAGSNGWTFVNGWSSTSGGTPTANDYPLAQDTCVFDNNSAGTSVSIGSFTTIGNWDCSTRTTPFTFILGGFYLFGNVTFSSSITLSSTGSPTFFPAAGNILNVTSSGATFPVSVTFSPAPTEAVMLLDNLSVTTRIDLLAGTLNLNGKTLSANQVNGTNAIIIFGNGNMQIGGNIIGSGINCRGSGNVTLTATSGASIDATNSNFPNVAFTATGSKSIAAGNTFNSLTVVPGVTVVFAGGSTTKFFNLNLLGSAGNLIHLFSSTTFFLEKLNGGVVNCDYLRLTRSAASPANTFFAGTNSVNVSGNSGWIFAAAPAATNNGIFLAFK